MKSPILSSICIACVLNAAALSMHAQAPDASTDRTAPSYDMKAQALLDLHEHPARHLRIRTVQLREFPKVKLSEQLAGRQDQHRVAVEMRLPALVCRSPIEPASTKRQLEGR